jgi:hypothetical protein
MSNQIEYLIPLFTDLNYILLQCACPDTWKIQKEIPVPTEEAGTTDAGDGGEALSTGDHDLWSQLYIYISFLRPLGNY